MPNVNQLRKSSYITRHEVNPPVLVTIRSYKEVNVASDGAPVDKKWILFFDELEKPMVLNSTNGQMIQQVTGSDPDDPDEFAQWIGHKIVLYDDPSISFGGKLVGGIRVRAPKKPAAPKPALQSKPAPAPAPEPEAEAGEDSDVPF